MMKNAWPRSSRNAYVMTPKDIAYIRCSFLGYGRRGMSFVAMYRLMLRDFYCADVPLSEQRTPALMEKRPSMRQFIYWAKKGRGR